MRCGRKPAWFATLFLPLPWGQATFQRTAAPTVWVLVWGGVDQTPAGVDMEGVAWAISKPSCLGVWVTSLLLTTLCHWQKELDDLSFFFFVLLGQSQIVPNSREWCKTLCCWQMLWEGPFCLHVSADRGLPCTENCYSRNFRTPARPPSLHYWALSPLPRIGPHCHANVLSPAKTSAFL